MQLSFNIYYFYNENKSIKMKLKTFFILSTYLLFLSTFSCSNTTEKSRKPVSKITISSKKNIFSLNDSIHIEITVNPKNGELGEAKLFIDNELAKTSNEINFSYSIPNINSLGKHEIKVVATKTDRIEGTNYESFEVFSDIEPEEFTYEVVNIYPHNTSHFTEGLEIHNGEFYESTGNYGESGIYKIDLVTGQIIKSIDLDDKYFGEGITIFNDKIYQMTYKAQKGFIYDLNNFALIDSFTYETEQGWGMTHDSKYLIKTDSSEFLHFIDPNNMQVVKKLPVYDNNGPIKYINELEYFDGYIYANIWTTNLIIKIEAETGKVISKINLDGLLSSNYNYADNIDVLNGIAINSENEKIYVTGKLWPKLFEIKLVKKD